MTDGGNLLEFLRRLFERRGKNALGATEYDWDAYLPRYEADSAPPRRPSLLKVIFGSALRS